METKLKITGSWEDVVDACRFTVSKAPLGKEPSAKFKKDILIAEHSPIRLLGVRWVWESIPHWVGVHWVRHKWECFVATQRTDRTGVQRDKLPQDEPQDFMGDANAQNLIDTMRKRLCYQASKETREYAENLKEVIAYYEPELADVLVPNCVYRSGCPEMGKCTVWKKFVEYVYNERYEHTGLLDIRTRYDYYNKWFYERVADEYE